MRKNDKIPALIFENSMDVFLNISSAVISYFAVYTVFLNTDRYPAPLQIGGKLLVVLTAIPLAESMLLYLFGAYSGARARLSMLRAVFATYAFSAGVSLIFFRESRAFVISWLIVSSVISYAALAIKSELLRCLFSLFARDEVKIRRIAIVADSPDSLMETAAAIEISENSSSMLVGYASELPIEGASCERLGGLNDISSVIERELVTDIIISCEHLENDVFSEIARVCEEHFVTLSLPVMKGREENIGAKRFVNVGTSPLDSIGNRILKRLTDIFVSLAMLIFALPIMLIFAVAIKMTSRGPVLFKQERVGLRGRIFTMYKLRTMRINSESSSAWTTDNDDRKTPVGAFLRRLAIDELPQLFNVLIGDMSLVGPRPEIPYLVDGFKNEIPCYLKRLSVKPGLTGLSQIMGLRGDTSLEKRVLTDIEYIENWSILGDIAILIKTPFNMINGKEKMPKHMGACEKNRWEIPKKRSDRRRILYIASTVSHINRFHLPYIDALRKDGYEVFTAGAGQGADFDIPFEKKIFSAANRACRFEIKKIISELLPDVIIMNTSLAAYHVRRSIGRERALTVNIVHGYLFGKGQGVIKNILLLAAEKLLSRRTDYILVMNGEDRRIAERYRLASSGVYMTFGMGVELKAHGRASDDIRTELDCSDGFVLAFVGEISNRKNQEFLIWSFPLVKEKIPNAVLWLIGGGNTEKLTRMALDTGLSQSIRILGYRENAVDYISACDLYVSASSAEGLPFNIVEALGCGKTVLASNIKGHRDIIRSGENGFLFDIRDVDAFVDTAVKIYSGTLKPSRREIERTARKYSFPHVFPMTYATIKMAVRKNG